MSDQTEASATGGAASTRLGKGASAFRTIGEVADDLDLPAHVLRFWESKFPQLKPLKRAGGRRYYRPEDIELLRRIRQCLYQDGYTIRGVQKLLGAGAGAGELQPGTDRPTAPSLFPLDPNAEPAAPSALPPSPKMPAGRARQHPAKPGAPDSATRMALEEIRQELIEVRSLLRQLMSRPKPP